MFGLVMGTGKIKVLIVDDSEDEAMLLKRSLRKSDCCEVIALLPDGQAALDYLLGTSRYADREQFPLPDVLLLDFKLPRMNGLEVLAWVRERNPGLHVIMLSNSFSPDSLAHCLQMGARHCLEKAEPAQDARRIEGFLKSLPDK